MKPYRELRELLHLGLRMGSGLRIPVSAQWRDHLLDQAGLAFRSPAHRPQMTRFQTESTQIRHKFGNGHRLGVVATLRRRSDEPVRLPLLELALGDLGGGQELRTPDTGRGGPPGLAVPGTVAQVPWTPSAGRDTCSPRARASRCSRMTLSGR